jgi:hypothetical protein
MYLCGIVGIEIILKKDGVQQEKRKRFERLFILVGRRRVNRRVQFQVANFERHTTSQQTACEFSSTLSVLFFVLPRMTVRRCVGAHHKNQNYLLLSQI